MLDTQKSRRVISILVSALKKGEDGLGDFEDPLDVTVAESVTEEGGDPEQEELSDERKQYEQLCRGEEMLSER